MNAGLLLVRGLLQCDISNFTEIKDLSLWRVLTDVSL